MSQPTQCTVWSHSGTRGKWWQCWRDLFGFAKAFDKVDFMGTLRQFKLFMDPRKRKVERLFDSFLTHIMQSVLVNRVRSYPSNGKAGVPQCSVLGPSFLVLNGDIDKNVSHAFLSSFVGDTRMGSQIASPTNWPGGAIPLGRRQYGTQYRLFELMPYRACYNQEPPSCPGLVVGASFKAKSLSMALESQ